VKRLKQNNKTKDNATKLTKDPRSHFGSGFSNIKGLSVKTSLLFSNRRLKPSSTENNAIVEQIQIIMIIVIRNIPILLSSSNYVVSEAPLIYNYVADKAIKATDLLIKLLV
jgi:hypothetical protein